MAKINKTTHYTVAELIKALQQFPQDMPIVVSGYESGFENILPPKMERLEQNPKNKYWDGEFQETDQSLGGQVIEAVVLSRAGRNV